MNSKKLLASLKGSVGEGMELFDFGVRHRQATDGHVGTVNHDEIAGPGVGPIKLVWISDGERQMKIALRVHLAGRHEVEPLRNLSVTLPQLRSVATGGSRDEIAFKKDK